MAANIDDAKRDLWNAIEQWQRHLEEYPKDGSEKLAYILDRRYDESSMSIDFLVGRDRLRARCLKEACQKERVCLFSAQMHYIGDPPFDEYEGEGGEKCTNYGRLEDCHDVEHQIEWELSALFNANGERLACNIDLSGRDFINYVDIDEAYKEDNSDTSSEDTGGSTPSRTCTVLVPQAHCFDFLSAQAVQGNVDLSVWIAMLLKEMDDKSTNEAARTDLEQLCRLMVTNNSMGSQGHCFSDTDMARIIKVIIILDFPELFESAAGAVHGSLPMSLLVDIQNFPQRRDWPQWKKGYVILMYHTTRTDAL